MDLNFLKNQPELQNLSQEKLDFLMQFANQSFPNNTQEMSAKFMEAMQHARSENVQFSQPETSVLINLLKSQLPEAERQKADRLIQLMQTMQRR